MRLKALVFVLAALGCAGFGAWRVGRTATAWIERETLAEARAELAASGEAWAGVEADGLLLTLTGAAPDEARRLAAEAALRRIAAPGRFRDASTLAAAPALTGPGFALEFLRSGEEISAVGIAPAGAGTRIAAALARAGLGPGEGDAVEEIERPIPDGWEAALDYGLAALAALPQSRVSIAPGRVGVTALASDAPEAEAATRRLRAAAPPGVAATLDIAAPRPAIAPFRFAFTLAAEGEGRLEACDVATPEDAIRLAEAAGADPAACRLGLGVPSPAWADAAAAGIAALRAIGGGRFALADLAATLEAPAEADPRRAEAAAARLTADLPAGFSLRFDTPAAPVGEDEPHFEATLSPEGALDLSGPLRNAMSAEAVTNYAEALFGDGQVTVETSLDPALPEGWPNRVFAALEALALLQEGRAEVTADLVSLSGRAADPQADAQAARLLGRDRLGPAEIAIRFDAAAAEAQANARALAEDPAGACLDAAREVLAVRGIGFEPGSARLSEQGLESVAAVAAALVNCPPLDIEIAGHTDASGSAAANQRLSEDRALSVELALEAIGLPHVRFIARGYGPDRPIADNDTEEGRMRNRRIEFALIGQAAPDPAPTDMEDRIGPQ